MSIRLIVKTIRLFVVNVMSIRLLLMSIRLYSMSIRGILTSIHLRAMLNCLFFNVNPSSLNVTVSVFLKR